MYEKYYKWVFPKYADKSLKNSDGECDCFRINVAKEQLNMKKVSQDDIISYVNDFFKIIGLEPVKNPEVDLISNPIIRGSYSRIMKDNSLSSKKDIVWMKFTQDKYLGVVATGTDKNFDIDNTSGKIITALNQKWDERYVLIFPLKKIPTGLNRQRIESGIGNYLISKNVPILDFYSHNL